MALSETYKEAIYLRLLFGEICTRYLSAVVVHTNNQGPKKLTENYMCHSRAQILCWRSLVCKRDPVQASQNVEKMQMSFEGVFRSMHLKSILREDVNQIWSHCIVFVCSIVILILPLDEATNVAFFNYYPHISHRSVNF